MVTAVERDEAASTREGYTVMLIGNCHGKWHTFQMGQDKPKIILFVR
jgi:hypothetical protein